MNLKKIIFQTLKEANQLGLNRSNEFNQVCSGAAPMGYLNGLIEYIGLSLNKALSKYEKKYRE